MRRSIVFTILLIIVGSFGGKKVVAQDTHDANKESVRQALSEYSADNPYAFSNFLAEPFMMNQGDATLYETSYTDVIEYDIALFAAMPDLHAVADVLIAQDDWVAASITYSGTYTQAFSFEPVTGTESAQPTNEVVSWSEIVFFRFNTIGLAEEVWSYSDPSILFGQLGVFPVDEEENDSATLDLPAGYQTLTAEEFAQSFESGMEARNRSILDEIYAQGLSGYIPSDDYFADPFIVWNTNGPSAITLESAQQDGPFTDALAQALPNNAITAEIVVAEGDWVAVNRSLTGTFTEDFDFAGFGQPIAHNDEQITWQQTFIYRFDAGGKIVEGWLQQDLTPLFVGLGLIPMDEE